MRIEEAQWIERTIARNVPAPAAGEQPVALNLGSGTRKAREIGKPYVQRQTIAPLQTLGYRVVHSDLLSGDGIDLSGDMFEPAFQQELQALRPALVMFCNVFEHLESGLRHRTPAVLDAVLAPCGLLLITAPYSYPYHADPIDTMYRPSPGDLVALFPGYEEVDVCVVDSERYMQEFMRAGLGRRIRKVLRLLFPFIRPRRWLSHAHRFLWLYRPYRHSCVLLRKPG